MAGSNGDVCSDAAHPSLASEGGQQSVAKLALKQEYTGPWLKPQRKKLATWLEEAAKSDGNQDPH